MQTQPISLSHLHPNVMETDSLAEFSRIQESSVEAIILNRNLPSAVSTFLSGIVFNKEKGERFFVPSDDIPSKADDVLGALGLAEGIVRNWLMQDIHKLAMQTGKILSTSNIQLRIGVIDDDSCRRFHRDNVKARMICTYRGPGTLYGFAKPGDEPITFSQVQTGQAILLKGKRWSAPRTQTLLHKSPPIEGTGISRLVVVMDEVQSLPTAL